jgi:hypothetical protein|tara:strand:+ start:1460 stop:1963 length:504 start_codon:yes stop_codon:yes gene_type:complete
MQKKVLTEQALYFGDVSMPKHWEIDCNDLAHHILHSTLTNKDIIFSRTLDKLMTYVREHVGIKHNINLINKKVTGNIYKPLEKSLPTSDVDQTDLRNSPDFTMLYGVKVKNCSVKIYYDDNRRKGRSWDIPLTNNKFIMFPSNNTYCIINNQKEQLNFVQKITFEYI